MQTNARKTTFKNSFIPSWSKIFGLEKHVNRNKDKMIMQKQQTFTVFVCKPF